MYSQIVRNSFRLSIYALALVLIFCVRAEGQRRHPDKTHATMVEAEYRNGQTFITWRDADTVQVKGYRVFHHASPITDDNFAEAVVIAESISPGSSSDYVYYSIHKKLRGFVITNLGEQLPVRHGLFVHTVKKREPAFYAVGSLDAGGNLVPSFVVGKNSLGDPVRQSPGDMQPVLAKHLKTETGLADVYIHWVGEDMHPREGMAYRFAVTMSADYKPWVRHPLLINLHGAGGRYGTVHRADDDWVILYPDMRTVTFHSEKYPGYSGRGSTFWYGLNSNFYNKEDPYGGINVNYTERRVLWTIRWVMSRYNIDPDRVHIQGSSMGGYGTLNFALRHPELFASASARVPNVDFHRMSDYANSICETHWGPRQDNILTNEGIGVYDRMDLVSFVRSHPQVDFPVIMMMNGKQDRLVGWEGVRLFYQAMQETNHALMAFWSKAGHGGLERPEFEMPQEFFEIDLRKLRRDESYPVISLASTNSNPGKSPEDGDPFGQLNGRFQWRDIVDRPNEYEVTIEPLNNRQLTATANVTPRRLQRFNVKPGGKYAYENIDLGSGKRVQKGIIKPDKHNLLTVRRFMIGSKGNRLKIYPAAK